jgi:hypothetical protein
LDILTGLWKGQPFNYSGKHYKIKETSFMVPPPPVQKPRIPIWVVGAWKREKSMQRALRYDGVLPNFMGEDGKAGVPTPDAIREMRDYIKAKRGDNTPFDIVTEGATPGDNPQKAGAIVREWAEAGATWWIEALWNVPGGLDSIRQRVRQGPPRI